MEEYINKNKYPKIVVMTQTRVKEFKNLNIFLSINDIFSIWPNNLKFIINTQQKSITNTHQEIKHHNYLEYQSPFLPLSQARNNLLKISLKYFQDFDYFIHIDDDAYIYDYSLLIQSLLYLKRQNLNCLIIGSVCNPSLDPISKHIKNLKTFKRFNMFNHNAIMGSCICYGKDLIKKNISFDNNFGLGSNYGGSEETELFFKAIEENIPIIYNPCFIVVHPPHFKNQYNFKKMFKYGFGRGAVYKKFLNINICIMFLFLIVGIIFNLIYFIIGIICINRSFALRNLGLMLGKIYGFIRYQD